MSIKVKRLVLLYTWAVASHRDLDAFFEKHPEFAEHKQGVWGEAIKNGVCKTAYCLAGQTAIHEGWTFLVARNEWEDYGDGKKGQPGTTMIPTDQVKALGLSFVRGSRKGFAQVPANKWDEVSEHTKYPATVARDSLGLDDYQAEMLFSGGNDVWDIKSHIEQFFADAGLNLRLPEPEDVVV